MKIVRSGVVRENDPPVLRFDRRRGRTTVACGGWRKTRGGQVGIRDKGMEPGRFFMRVVLVIVGVVTFHILGIEFLIFFVMAPTWSEFGIMLLYPLPLAGSIAYANQGEQAVQTGKETMQQMTEQFDKIRESSISAVQQLAQIETMTLRQAEANEQLSSIIFQIKESTQETSASAEQTHNALRSLKDLVAQLQAHLSAQKNISASGPLSPDAFQMKM